MASVKTAYAASTTITCTLASLTTGSAQRSAAVDNSSNLYVDAMVLLSVTTGTVSGTNPYVAVYAYASADDGTTYETGGSTNAAYTLRGDEKLLGIIATPANTTAYAGVFNIAKAYGGVLPRNWGIIVSNISGSTLSGTEGNHVKAYQGITYTVA